MSAIKAIFLDRDGVINIDKSYVYKIDDFEFIDGVFSSLKYLQSLGYKIFIITNQSGIARGYYSIEDFNVLTSWMIEKFKIRKINIEDVKHCPHSPDENCNCRKPKTGMIDEILKKYDINLNDSWLIGDKDSDIKCATNAKIPNTIKIVSKNKLEVSDAKFICSSIANIEKIIKI